jgi:hypothetical protein
MASITTSLECELKRVYHKTAQMALWDSKTGFQLLKTEDKTQYFLNVEPHPDFKDVDGETPLTTEKRLAIIKPFMKLKEVGATWHAEEKGWLIPKAQFPFLALFIELISHLHMTVRETIVKQKDKALIVNIVLYEASVLVSLCDRKELLEQEAKAAGSQTKIKLDSPFTIDSPELKVIANGRSMGDLVIIAEERLDSFLDIVLCYIEALNGKLQKGDLVRILIQYTTYVYDGKRLVKFGHIEDGKTVSYLPKEFTTPPFPVAYWHYQYNDLMVIGINPNFDLKGTILEFDDDAPKLVPIVVSEGEGEGGRIENEYLANVKPNDEFVVLQVTPPQPYKPFYVYFVNNDKSINMKFIGETMRHPKAWYQAFNDTTIIGHLDDVH